MPLFLKTRDERLTELMDEPDCNSQLLFNTYQQFTTINKLLSGWQRIYKTFISAILNDPQKTYSILDIGCGGGDVIRHLMKLTEKEGINVTFTGIDPDARAIQFSNKQDWPENVTFIQATASELAEKNETFDIVISNHLMHHLQSNSLLNLCKDAEKLARKRVIFNDIERSDIGYASFRLAATPFFHESFIVPDGLTSIKRSFRKDELQEILPDGWNVHRQFPFRLLAVYDAKKQ